MLITCHYPGVPFGMWSGDIGEGYFILKFKIDTSFHYGWIRASKTPDNLIIKDFAYNLVPDMPMIAGDTNFIPFNIENLSIKTTKIFPNPTTGFVTVHCVMQVPMTISLFNIFGEIVLQTETNKNDFDLDFTKMKRGIYYINITDTKQSFISKIIKI
jgi:hypothetical protein